VRLLASPDPTVAAFFSYLTIDHLTHAKALAKAAEEQLSDELAAEADRLPDGRALQDQFRAIEDLLKEPYSASADPGTKVNIRLVRASDIQVRELIERLMIAGGPESLADLSRELGAVEVEHQLLTNSLINPSESVAERLFYGELAEVMGLNRLLATEKSGDAQDAYEFVVDEDEEHLRYAGAMVADIMDKDPSELSESRAFTARPRRKLENYLSHIVETAGDARLIGGSISQVA
jgi:hypothetical protein